MIRFLSRASLVALSLLFMACSASNMTRLEAGEEGDHLRLYSNNSLLASRLAVEEIQTKRVNDLLYMQATLENGWKFELDFQYKIKWFDRHGFELAPESQPWRQLVMAGRSQSNVQAVAPNPSAVRFEIWVRE